MLAPGNLNLSIYCYYRTAKNDRCQISYSFVGSRLSSNYELPKITKSMTIVALIIIAYLPS